MARYRTTMAELLKKVYEDGHEDVSSSKRMCQTIIEDATQIRTKLDSMGPEDKLDTWWTNKLAKSADNLNSARDYIMNPIEESFELDEGRMKDIYTMQQQGKSAAEIAKLMKLPVKTVKDILGEGEEIEESLIEFTSNQIKDLQKSYGDLKGKTISPEKATALSKHLDRIDLMSLRQLLKAKIPFVSTLARNKIYKKTGKFEEVEQPEKEKKETENKDSVIATLKDQIAMLKQKLENEKNKAVKPEPNPETGEVPLTIGLANKLLKDKEMKKEAFAVQITKKNGEKIVHGRYNNKADADKFIKWYKTGDMKDTKSIQIIVEADLTKPQIKKVHKMADELPKKDFKDRYGKEKGDAVRYATATNIVKKKLGIEESAAAREIDRTNTRRDSMDYQMYKKSAELLRKKDYKSLGQHIDKSETAPREYVMGVIAKKEPQTFTKLYGKQTGYYSLMKPLKMSENKEADIMFKKLSQRAQTYVNELLRSGMGTMEAIQKAKDKFNEGIKEMSTNEEKRLYVEKIAALQKKADKSGMPYGILKKVYDRGMAAWKGGHRPGASQHQWAFARVNSFVTKSSGTWGGADKDLAAKVRGSK